MAGVPTRSHLRCNRSTQPVSHSASGRSLQPGGSHALDGGGDAQVVERLSQFERVLDSGAVVPPALLDATAATESPQSPFGSPVDENGLPATGIQLVDCDGVGFWDCDVTYLLQVPPPYAPTHAFHLSSTPHGQAGRKADHTTRSAKRHQ
jgi:hypothetical protein